MDALDAASAPARDEPKLYEVHQEIVGGDAQVQPQALVAKRISVGTPNVAELIGELLDIANTAAALLIAMNISTIDNVLAEAVGLPALGGGFVEADRLQSGEVQASTALLT